MTLLYCIGTDDGFIKVGLSENPVGRLSQLQVGNHRKLTLLHPGPNYDGASSITPECDPNAIEREMHEALRHRHARGEWFFGTLETFEKAVEVVQYSETIFRTKSTAARTDVPRKITEAGRSHPVRTGVEPEAGTQAPPVDTRFLTDADKFDPQPIIDAEMNRRAGLTARGTPRQRAPKGTFDRKAYQRVKAKERRAAKAAKAAKEPK